MTCDSLLFSCSTLSLLELFMSILSPMSCFLSCHLLSFLLWILVLCLDLLLYSLFLLYKGLMGNTYLKEYTNDSKQGYCCHRVKGHLYPMFQIICLYYSPLLQISNNVQAKMCKIILKNTSSLDLFLQMIY
jgi:hypothetical protein